MFEVAFGFVLWLCVCRWVFGGRLYGLALLLVLLPAGTASAQTTNTPRVSLHWSPWSALGGRVDAVSGTSGYSNVTTWLIPGQMGVQIPTGVNSGELGYFTHSDGGYQAMVDFGEYYMCSYVVGRHWTQDFVSGQAVGWRAAELARVTVMIWKTGEDAGQYVTVWPPSGIEYSVFLSERASNIHYFKFDAPMSGRYSYAIGPYHRTDGPEDVGRWMTVAQGPRIMVDNLGAMGTATTQPTSQPSTQPTQGGWMEDWMAAVFGEGEDSANPSMIRRARSLYEDAPEGHPTTQPLGSPLPEFEAAEGWEEAYAAMNAFVDHFAPGTSGGNTGGSMVLMEKNSEFMGWIFMAVDEFAGPSSPFAAILSFVRIVTTLSLALSVLWYAWRQLAWAFGWKHPEHADMPLGDL